ncbi:MAG: sulfate adenylyltransferase subunit CysD [Planctomycetota bacterium]
MNRLDDLENRSIYVIREAYARFRSIAALWSIGKDSSAVIWLCRKAFFGKIPFPVLHIDTGFKFKEMYAHRDRYAKEWGLDLRVIRNEEAITRGMSPRTGKFECCHALKTVALRQAMDRFGFDALLLGIRRDEHGIRAKERYFSPRDTDFSWDYKNQPPEFWDQYVSREEDAHVRVHPLLHWTEYDVWAYVQREGIPASPLYFARGGKRYRSLGCETCCRPVDSNASTIAEIVEELRTTRVQERSGRAQDKESAYTMQKLRALGYM